MMDKTIRLILIIPLFVILLLLFNYTAAPRDPLVQEENVPPAYEKRGKLGIFGGTAVTRSAEFPFNLKLYHQGAFICGAAIIGPRIGITAAHCLTKDKKNPGNFQVIAGSVDFRFAANVATNGPIWKGEQGRRLTKIKLHPKYWSLVRKYDIAIFQVDETFVFDKWVNKIPFPRTEIPGIVSTTEADPPPGFFPYLNKDFSHFSNSTNLEPPANLTGLTAIATGWGETYQGLPKTLQKVELPVVECDNFFNWQIKGLDYPICAGIPNSGKDTCSGDSGGPLFIYVQPSVPLLVGITSFGFGCGGPTPGIYTNVRFYTEWIQDAALTLESGGHSNKAAVPPTLLLIIMPSLVWVQLSA